MRNLTRIAPMISLLLLAILAALALITQAGVAVLQRNHPAQGSTVAVPGARLNILDIGPRHAPGPPIVMIHGASSNLEVMRQPVGERLAGNHRVILIDLSRPWLEHTRAAGRFDSGGPGQDDCRGAG